MAVAEESLDTQLERIGRQARAASDALRGMSRAIKDQALLLIADRLVEARERLQAENEKDLVAGREKGLSSALLDRLELTD